MIISVKRAFDVLTGSRRDVRQSQDSPGCPQAEGGIEETRGPGKNAKARGRSCDHLADLWSIPARVFNTGDVRVFR
jgi:hypothetical protein